MKEAGMMAGQPQARCCVVLVIIVVVHLPFHVGLSQTCPALADSIRDLEERFTCLEQNLDQLIESSRPKDCSDINDEEDHANGVYTIQPKGSRPFRVLCLFDADGKWTVIQRRVNGLTDFQRPWLSYRNGFGQLSYTSNFWLGLEKMYQITRQRQYKLRVDLLGWGGESTYAEYSIFYIGDEEVKYRIFYDSYSGTAGDHFGTYHLWAEFSTTDRDNDNHADADYNCAKMQGPWWHNGCDRCNLNGQYGQGTGDTGIEWGTTTSFKETCMRIRPTFDDELDWLEL